VQARGQRQIEKLRTRAARRHFGIAVPAEEALEAALATYQRALSGPIKSGQAWTAARLVGTFQSRGRGGRPRWLTCHWQWAQPGCSSLIMLCPRPASLGRLGDLGQAGAAGREGPRWAPPLLEETHESGLTMRSGTSQTLCQRPSFVKRSST
jgi:hypothetical protein